MGGISLITIYDRKFRHNRPEEGLPKMITYISPINMVAEDNHLYFAYKSPLGIVALKMKFVSVRIFFSQNNSWFFFIQRTLIWSSRTVTLDSSTQSSKPIPWSSMATGPPRWVQCPQWVYNWGPCRQPSVAGYSLGYFQSIKLKIFSLGGMIDNFSIFYSQSHNTK